MRGDYEDVVGELEHGASLVFVEVGDEVDDLQRSSFGRRLQDVAAEAEG